VCVDYSEIVLRIVSKDCDSCCCVEWMYSRTGNSGRQTMPSRGVLSPLHPNRPECAAYVE
jgi:hypothetical protein